MKFRLLSYNIHKGFCLFQNFTLPAIKRAIQDTNVDFCLLQEVVGDNTPFRQKIKDWPTEPQFEFLADSVWPHFKYGKNAVFPDRHHGNAILSKYPIQSSHNLNISTNRFEQRGLLHCSIEIPAEIPGQNGLILNLLNTHLNLMHGARLKQTERIIQWIEQNIDPQSPTLLAGDFNDWQGALSSHFHNRLSLHECFLSSRGGHAKTFPSHLPILSLDRVYSRAVRITSQETLTGAPWSGLSDHLPLIVEFEVDVATRR